MFDLALVMLAIFILVAVVARVAYQYKISGDHGVRPASRQASTVNKVASVLFAASFIGIFVLSIVDIYPIEHRNLVGSTSRQVIGIVICLAGIVLTSYSQFSMGRNWRMGVDENEKTMLVTTGIYSLVRNPIYTGVAIFLLGQLLLIPYLTTLVFVVMALISIHLHVRYIEEPYLLSQHGEPFIHYQQSTGAYLPKIRQKT